MKLSQLEELITESRIVARLNYPQPDLNLAKEHMIRNLRGRGHTKIHHSGDDIVSRYNDKWYTHTFRPSDDSKSHWITSYEED